MNKPVTRTEIEAQGRRIPPASQATSIEQSRAVAEVQAAVVVAQQRPRDETTALAKAMASCKQMAVAESAFFKFPRGGQTVQGETIHLAVELARCWGNINYGIMELARHDYAHESEMLAFAWDLETNTQSRMTFIVPHKRDKKGGAEILTDMRDIYENNANNGARRLRECIFRVLPPYLKEQAKATCIETMRSGGGDEPLPVRITKALEAFQKIGISADRIEKKFGAKAKWTELDLVNLQVSYKSITRNEIAADEEFPRNETADVNGQVRQAIGQRTDTPDNSTAAEGPADEQRGDGFDGSDDTPAWQGALSAHLNRLATVEFKADVNMAISDFSISKAALPDDVRVEVDAAEFAALARFNSNEGN